MDRRNYQRLWQQARRREQGVPERVVQGHGTAAGYRRHRYHSEPPCPDCRMAWAEYRRARYAAAKRARSSKPAG